MKDNIKILDCTLRDGGYINDWKFGFINIKSIIARLTMANIDVVEVGFLEDHEYDKECSFFSEVDQIIDVLPQNRGKTQFVAMTRYGELDINNLKEYDGRSIDGIRITFHENEVDGAMEFCKLVKEKGYKVFVQPVGTTSYTDQYLLKLIDIVNQLEPYAFYIVDTLGLMKKNDLLRMFYLVDNNLKEDIILGFHSHNNLQLSFSNSQELVDLHTNRQIMIDSSVYGMGRGAGNLNTELITQHLNLVRNCQYRTDYLLEIIDDTIGKLREIYTWGYSVPYYLAAINNCHPNYATYLINRKTLPIKSISTILKNITQDQRELYNKKYIEELYQQFQQHNIDDTDSRERLKELLTGRNILIIAPGSSLTREAERIRKHIRDHQSVVISVNFDGDEFGANYSFYSNAKRFEKNQEVKSHLNGKCPELIITSNITADEGTYKYKVNYSDYLNAKPLVNDNATLMLLSLLIKMDIPRVDIAGFDGFKLNAGENYIEEKLETNLDDTVIVELNRQITEVVKEYSQMIELNFITDSMYQVDKVYAAK
jgi:4-hydroxy 2-oxovalerate aldolase